ncbi:MAG: universal stress protein [Proteobacteria bacterium]|nr:universal stress protein [Pseudomonadota bacterium]
MKKYHNILLAVELNPKSDSSIIQKAKEFKEYYQADLTLLHVVEHLSNYGAAYGVSAGIDIEEILINEAKSSIQRLGGQLGIPELNQVVKIGPTSQTIIEAALEKHADLIIIGSHGRHGVRLILGSTANGVLHAASCDVLAVRLKD